MEKMIYHGSDHIIERPEFGYGKTYNDYGTGFYCTENPNMAKEWYKKKAFRDQSARRQYFDTQRNHRQRGDLYISTILDEEMKPDDPRLR